MKPLILLELSPYIKKIKSDSQFAPGKYLIAKTNLPGCIYKYKKYKIVDTDEADMLIKTKKGNLLFTYDTIHEWFFSEQELRKEKLLKINGNKTLTNRNY